MRTVIVDDDGLVAISLKTILEAQGIEVAATGNDGKKRSSCIISIIRTYC